MKRKHLFSLKELQDTTDRFIEYPVIVCGVAYAKMRCTRCHGSGIADDTVYNHRILNLEVLQPQFTEDGTCFQCMGKGFELLEVKSVDKQFISGEELDS